MSCETCSYFLHDAGVRYHADGSGTSPSDECTNDDLTDAEYERFFVDDNWKNLDGSTACCPGHSSPQDPTEV